MIYLHTKSSWPSIFFSLLIVATNITSLTGQPVNVPKYDVFGEDDVLEITLRSDFKQFIKNKMTEDDQPAQISMILYDTMKIEMDLKIKARGNSRRTVCYMPPILLDFPKKDVPPVLEGLNKLKLVTYCKDTRNYDQYILKEYLAYKLYNILTEYSLKVRLLKVTYEDTEGKMNPVTALGFIIEDIDDMAERFGYKEINTVEFNPNYLDRDQTALMEVFQYMIGNTDWSSLIMHNMKLIAKTDSIQLNTIPVAYDFDVSGFVNPPYATPNPQLPIDNVKTRLYRGFCRSEPEFKLVFKLFLDRKKSILDLISNHPYLAEKTVKEAQKYLEEFFEIIESDKAIARTIMVECR